MTDAPVMARAAFLRGNRVLRAILPERDVLAPLVTAGLILAAFALAV
jgi:hypothetical protein